MTILFADALQCAMLDAGFNIVGNIDFRRTNRCQRFQDAKLRKGKDIFLFIHGERGATFGTWQDKENAVTWWADKERQYPITREQVLKRAAEKMAQDEEQARKASHATRRAIHFWTETPVMLNPNESPIYHSYIRKKRINPYFCKYIRKKRWIKEVLLLPIRNIDYCLKSLQIIKANGFKRFWKGASFKGNM